MAELKPCPFCGGKSVKIVYWDEEEQNEKAWEHGCEQDEEHYLCVRCYDCDIQFFGGTPISGYELIEAWNRRAEMSKLTLDDAIKHCLEVAEQKECKMTSDDGYTDVSMKRCAAEHRQLAEWLTELKEAKRLLKAAVEDFKEINSDILTCKYCRWYSEEIDECTYYPEDTPCEQICGWEHEVEALKLIGDENNET